MPGHRDRPYTKEDYKNKLLLKEREIIEKALIKHKQVKIHAHKELCPNNNPYTYSALLRRMRKHGI